MPLTCRIERLTGRTTTDRETGKVISEKELVYEGCCKITTYEGHEQERDVAGYTATIQRLSIHIPVAAETQGIGVYQPRVGDIIAITDTDGIDDRLLDMQFRMAQEAPYRTYATADRIFIDSIAK